MRFLWRRVRWAASRAARSCPWSGSSLGWSQPLEPWGLAPVAVRVTCNHSVVLCEEHGSRPACQHHCAKGLHQRPAMHQRRAAPAHSMAVGPLRARANQLDRPIRTCGSILNTSASVARPKLTHPRPQCLARSGNRRTTRPPLARSAASLADSPSGARCPSRPLLASPGAHACRRCRWAS